MHICSGADVLTNYLYFIPRCFVVHPNQFSKENLKTFCNNIYKLLHTVIRLNINCKFINITKRAATVAVVLVNLYDDNR